MAPTKPKARTWIFDVLGDFLRCTGATEIRLKALVALGTQLDITPENMRALATRMRDEGWLHVRRAGRESIYSLSPRMRHTLELGRERIFRAEPDVWTGSWSVVVYSVPEADRASRELLRRELSWLGFAPMAAATWVSPLSLLGRVAPLRSSVPEARLELMTMRSEGLDADRSIAQRCWNLAAVNDRYAEFIRDLGRRVPAARWDQLSPADAFVARIELVHSYRHFPNLDPGLPTGLQPSGWLGEQARRLFQDSHAILEATAEDHYRAVLAAP